ncbi:mannose-1-phosphate guanyltransferase alpha-like isoform X6 [Camellia sinensis]|uniref:mannose-1-phosphate guanyltransferase alpha-like isoform X6 n=1 Tax=Camellia sinensis TaxID=4442 RepID=UPI0010366637|nr:mannose-1-phosphate guanyltransferase alpha-like isoform X6 [Camellia sinensis]
MKVMLQYYIERQCLLKCTRQIIMHTWKSIMQLDNPVVPIGGIETILVIKVSAESANQFGELVADPVTNELLHYTEKPETFVSDRINCGVYIFTPDFFNAIQGVSIQRKDRGQ